MDFNRSAYAKVCAESGFTKQELATIYGVSRQTIYDWLGKAAPTQLALAARATATTAALAAALEKRVLPLSASIESGVRRKRIDVIIKTVMESLKPARG